MTHRDGTAPEWPFPVAKIRADCHKIAAAGVESNCCLITAFPRRIIFVDAKSPGHAGSRRGVAAKRRSEDNRQAERMVVLREDSEWAHLNY
jgi:hypothetical protein